jgi:small conductance mechanosensitive channel
MNLDINFEKIAQDVTNWLSNQGLTIAVVLLVAEICNHFLGKIIARAVDQILSRRHYPSEKDRDQRASTLKRLFGTTSRICIWTISVVVILVQLGVDLTAVIAGAGFFGLAFGIGAQSLIQDVIGGIFIIIENQYRVGDIVEINGQSGEVVDITMRITQLRDIDGNAHFIPNGEIKHAINKSIGFSKIHITLNVAFDTDIEKLEEVINKTGHELVAKPKFGKLIEEAPHFARISEFGESGLEIKIFGVVKPGEQWLVSGEYRKMLKTAFEKAGIEIPYRQVVIHNQTS